MITWKCGLHQAQCIALIYYVINNVLGECFFVNNYLYEREIINKVISNYNLLLNNCKLCKILNHRKANYHESLLKYYKLPFTDFKIKSYPYIEYDTLKRLNLEIEKPIIVSTNKIRGKEFCLISKDGLNKIQRVYYNNINHMIWPLSNKYLSKDILEKWKKVKVNFFQLSNNILLGNNLSKELTLFKFNNNFLEEYDDDLIFEIDISIPEKQIRHNDINIDTLYHYINNKVSFKILYGKKKYLYFDKGIYKFYQNNYLFILNDFF